MIVVLIKKYITCEGRYNYIYRFHMRFLLHIVGWINMNLPFFILKSLSKMSNKVQKYHESAITSLAHPCLITSLVYHELCGNKIDEKIFLVDDGFDLKEDIDIKAKERRKRKNTGHKRNSPVDSRNNMKPEVKFTYIRKKKEAESSKMNTRSSIAKKSDEEKGKVTIKPKRRVTRITNKFKLNAKARLKPTLRSTEPV